MPATDGGPGLDFRDMTETDLAEGLRLSRASGWNQTPEDWRLLMALGPGLFRVGVEHGRVVASGGAVRYGGALAWICMILVEPASRGRGLGGGVFAEVLVRCEAERRAGRLRAIGLDATPAGRGIYRGRGFLDASQLVRLRAETGPAVTAPESVEPLRASSRDEALALDRQVFGADRGRVLSWALDQAPTLAWVCRVGGRVVGYCFGRHGDHSDHAGPVVAESSAIAHELVRACLSRPRSRPLILDARAEPPWLATLGALGFREQRPLTRMYLGEERPKARPTLEHAVFGPEFG